MDEKIALVTFDGGKKKYAYRTNFLDLKKGNAVNVQVGIGKGHKHATFEEYTDDPEMDKIATAIIISKADVDLNTLNLNKSKKKELIKKTMKLIDVETNETIKNNLKKKLNKYLKEYYDLI